MKFIDTRIREIDDPDFQSLITELCNGLEWDFCEFAEKSMADLLRAMVQEKRKLTKMHLRGPGVLTRKADKIHPDSLIYQVCTELAIFSGETVESYGGKTVLTLISDAVRYFRKRLGPKKHRV